MSEDQNLKAVKDAAAVIKQFCSSIKDCDECCFWEYCRQYLGFRESLEDVMSDLETAIEEAH